MEDERRSSINRANGVFAFNSICTRVIFSKYLEFRRHREDRAKAFEMENDERARSRFRFHQETTDAIKDKEREEKRKRRHREANQLVCWLVPSF